MPSPGPASEIVNLLTVDVEDYYQVSGFEGVVSPLHWENWRSRVCRNTERLLDLFAEYRVAGTFFVLGWVAERHPDLVRRIVASGHEIASHGYAHRLVYSQSPEQFRTDIRRGRNVLEDITGRRVFGYRAPSYSITARSWWALDVLIEEGFVYDASIYPIRHDRYGVPDAPRHPYWIERPGGRLWELPGSTVRLAGVNLPCGGGGYFRLLPYAWTRWAMRRLNQVERKAGVFYIHPWEIDPEQPRLPVGALTRLRHYHNLEKTEFRLRRLLEEFSFGRVVDLSALMPDAAVFPGLAASF